MSDNGIDWILLLREWWPVFTFFLGWFVGAGLNWHYTHQHLRAQRCELQHLRKLSAKLASDNQRIIDYTNDLIRRERDGRRN